MQIDGYDIEILVQGYPGKTVCHGGLGWSTIVLIRGQRRVALVDTGGFGVRKILLERLAHHGLKPTEVTDLLLTHGHHDHCVNWTLFRKARIVISTHELAWAVKEPWGETAVPELYVKTLAGRLCTRSRTARRCCPASPPMWRPATRRAILSMC
jgi:glyoxylase-like metal-dependent hydrolase (beta-lactamase superfamily II)